VGGFIAGSKRRHTTILRPWAFLIQGRPRLPQRQFIKPSSFLSFKKSRATHLTHCWKALDSSFVWTRLAPDFSHPFFSGARFFTSLLFWRQIFHIPSFLAPDFSHPSFSDARLARLALVLFGRVATGQTRFGWPLLLSGWLSGLFSHLKECVSLAVVASMPNDEKKKVKWRRRPSLVLRRQRKS